MSSIKRILSEITKSIGQRGIAGTAARCVMEPLYQLWDWSFDRRFDVETSEIVTVEDLDIQQTDRPHAHKYQPVRLHAFAEIMRHLAIRHEEFTFVDFGCGKGRAVLLASQFPFRKIIGVELSQALCQIAMQNLRSYSRASRKCKNLEIRCENAASYAIPPEPSVFFFFNPFDEAVMQAVLDNLEKSLRNSPREVFLILYNPVLDQLVGRVRFLELWKSTGRCSIYRSTGSFTIESSSAGMLRQPVAAESKSSTAKGG